MTLVVVQDGVNVVAIIQQLFKNMTLCYADGVSGK